jgi:hypothetical protein
MVMEAITTGVPFGWVAGNEVYGRASKLRAACEQAGRGYVFAVPVNFQVRLPSGRKATLASLARLIPARCWETRSCGVGCKGRREYDWAWAATSSPRRHVLICRTVSDPSELAFFYCHPPWGRAASLPVLIAVAGKRWPVEECHQQGKGRPAWMATRSGCGPPSTGTPCCPCARSRSWPSPPPGRCHRTRYQRPPRHLGRRPARGLGRHRDPPCRRGRAAPRRPRHGQGQRPRSSAAAQPGHRADDRRRPPARIRLVPIEAPASSPRPLPPLPGTTPGSTHMIRRRAKQVDRVLCCAVSARRLQRGLRPCAAAGGRRRAGRCLPPRSRRPCGPSAA